MKPGSFQPFEASILDICACPVCKAPDLEPRNGHLRCRVCARTYVNEDGLFHLLPDTFLARGSGQSEWAFWSKMQGIYKRWVETDWDLEAALHGKELYREFARRFVGDAGVVVDLGGFWGANRGWVREGAFYLVVDPDDEAIRQPSLTFMREVYDYYGEPCPFIHGVGEYLPIRSGSVDCIICQDALDHFLMPEAVVHECYRALRPGGTLALSLEVGGVSEQRGPVEDLIWMLRNKGAMAVGRGIWWRLKRSLLGVNRHGHIHQFTRDDVDRLLSIFPDHGYAAPETPGFEGKTFVWATKS